MVAFFPAKEVEKNKINERRETKERTPHVTIIGA